MSDLELSFAVDEQQLGQLITVPLLPGGSARQVTNDNRILYVHLMAEYRLNRHVNDTTPYHITSHYTTLPHHIKPHHAGRRGRRVRPSLLGSAQ